MYNKNVKEMKENGKIPVQLYRTFYKPVMRCCLRIIGMKPKDLCKVEEYEKK